MKLHDAAKIGDVAALQAALAAGAEIDKPAGAKRQTALHLAAKAGHASAVAVLLSQGAEPDPPDRDQQTPLMLAIQAEQEAAAAALLAGGSDPKRVNKHGANALFSACFQGHLELAKALARAGADLRAGTQDLPPLHVAAARGHLGVLSWLLDSGVPVDLRNSSEQTALHVAASHGKLKAAQLLLARGADPGAQDSAGNVPAEGARGNARRAIRDLLGATIPPANALIAAVRDRDVARARQALDQGADPDTAGMHHRPLHHAAEAGEVQLVQLLLERGADPNGGGFQGKRPLHLLYHLPAERQVEIATLLLDAGADPNLPCGEGTRPLDTAAEGYSLAAIDLLLARGAELNGRSRWGKTPIHHVMRPEILQALLERGADPRAPDEDGRTPLHGAAWWGSVERASALLDAGADLNAQNKWGETALHVAINSRTEMAVWLIERGARLDLADHQGRTPADLARERGQSLVVEAIAAKEAGRPFADPAADSLWEALARRDVAELRALLDAGGNANARDLGRGGESLLHRAIENDDRASALLLIERGADLYARNERGRPPISRGIYSNTLRDLVLEILEGYPFDLRFTDDAGEGPLHWAAACADGRLLRLLIAKGAPLDAADRWGRRPLDQALQSGCSDNAWLLLRAGAAVGRVPGQKSSPVHKAIRNSNLKVLTALLDRGADLEDFSGETSEGTPLTTAILAKKDAMARLLIERGASLEGRGFLGYTPLMTAIYQGDLDLARLLLEKGARPSGTSDYGATPLHVAARKGMTAPIELLLEAGADVLAADGNGQTPLHAATESSGEIIPLLIAAGARLEEQDRDGKTPLHVAAFWGGLGPVRALLAAGAAQDIKDNEGNTPREVAEKWERPRCVALLSG